MLLVIFSETRKCDACGFIQPPDPAHLLYRKVKELLNVDRLLTFVKVNKQHGDVY